MFYLIVSDNCADHLALPTLDEVAKYLNETIDVVHRVLVVDADGLAVSNATDAACSAMVRDYRSQWETEDPDYWPDPHPWIADKIRDLQVKAEAEVEHETACERRHRAALSDIGRYV
ncbi:MAG: hypothetical protein AAFR46_02760 [Pseudomonadota bacterium]